MFAQNIQYLIGGIIVVEYLFAYSGIGKELVDSVGIRDVRAVQSIAVLLAAIYIVVNILADLAGGAPHPEARGRRHEERPASSVRRRALVGLVLVVLVVALALFGPFFAPHSPTETIAIPFERPTGAAPLGTDELGRDVLSRVLWGGRSVLGLALLATGIAYAGGLAIGLLAGYARALARRRC